MRILQKIKVLISIVLCVGLLFSQSSISFAANSPGTMTFQVKTVGYQVSGGYDPKNVGAIWIEDNAGKFVKTIDLWAKARIQYLNTWIAKSNKVDVITSATLTTHQLHNPTWNCTNVSGAVVPDGTYKVFVEYTTSNGAGKVINPITFEKGTSAVSSTPTNQTYFTNMSLAYTPSLAIPSAPTGLTVTTSDGSVGLSWSASTGAATYNIKRSATSGGAYTTIKTGVTNTSYTDTGLTNDTTYYYVVSALNTAGVSPDSTQISAKPMPIPTSPTRLAVTAGNATANLSWTAPNWASTYNVKRYTTPGGPYTTIQTGLTATSYTDIGIVNGKPYYYVVSAVNTTGESVNSLEVTTTPTNTNLTAAKTALDITGINKTAVISNFTLPLTGLNGSAVSWLSDSTGVIAVSGANATVTRQVLDNIVNLTAILNINGDTTTKVFPITVLADSTFEPLKSAYSALDIVGIDKLNVKNDIILPLTGLNGATITWKSNNDALLISGSYAKITHSVSANVVLTASITIGNRTINKEFNIKLSGAIPQSKWNILTTSNINTLHSIKSYNGSYISVGTEGTVLTSSDGTTWTAKNIGSSLYLYDVIKSATKYITVGYGGTIYTSTDANTWATAISGTAEDLNSIAVNTSGNMFVAVGDNGAIVYSTDGTSWSVATSNTTNTLNKVYFDGTNFVAVGNFDTVLKSPNGISWTKYSTGTFADLYDIIKIGTEYRAVGSAGTLAVSSDLANWRPIEIGNQKVLYSIINDGSQYWITGEKGLVVSSTDGNKWIGENISNINDLYSINWDGSKVIAVGTGGITLSGNVGDYYINYPSFTDSTGATTILKPSEIFTVKSTITNRTGNLSNAVMAVALYDGSNKLLQISTDNQGFSANQSLPFSASVNLPSRVAGCYVKVFWFTSLASNKPIFSSFVKFAKTL